MTSAYQFIDFGAGHGQSFDFALACAPGRGLAVDRAEAAIERCQSKGLEGQVGDVLVFDQRNLAPATFAINLLQELPGRSAFREGLINIVRAGTEFTVVQHCYYDKDADLMSDGLQVPEHFSKSILYKPTLADYVDFLQTYYKNLSIAGIAVFVTGVAMAEPLPLLTSGEEGRRVAKTMRVIIGRKHVARFRRALGRAKSGKPIFLWEAS
jgi:hypothetical protein